MDCLFNSCIPESTPEIIIVRPIGKTWINGLSSFYDDEYPRELLGIMTEEDYKFIINDINDTLFVNWPCFFCMCFGYGFALCTLGLTLCIPHSCVKTAYKRAERNIDEINRNFTNKGFKLKLVVRCSTSWIEIHVKHTTTQI